MAGAPQERFSRRKRTKEFPHAAVQFCLDSVGVTLADVDAVGQAWNPAAYWGAHNPIISGTRIRREDYLYSIPDNLLQHTNRRAPLWLSQTGSDGELPPIYFITHHACHAATAYFTSPFEEAAILTADWRGEVQTGLFGVGKGPNIDILQEVGVPHSLGMLYATFTQLLGYKPDSDEWKVMALSAFEADSSQEEALIWTTLNLDRNGWFELDQSFYAGHNAGHPHLYTEKLVDLLGGKVGKAGEIPTEWHFRVARAMQHVSEKIAFHALHHLYEMTHAQNVVLGGGFFMNSVLNGKIADRTPFSNVFIPFAPADVGNSIGSALFIEHMILGRERTLSLSSSLLGPRYTDLDIVATLERRSIRYERMTDPVSDLAHLIKEAEIVAVFDGRMEFGERALGNRSILADPRKADIKEQVNRVIKYREAYRPFAPVCPLEVASQYFEVSEHEEIPFMEKVVPVRPQFREDLAAITHVDGSARVQTLRRSDNARLHSVLLEVEKWSGYPVLLNTSFNVNGEPIVCTPDDALTSFYNSGLKVLVMGDLVIRK